MQTCPVCDRSFCGRGDRLKFTMYSYLGTNVFNPGDTLVNACVDCSRALVQLNAAVIANTVPVVRVQVDEECTGIVGPFVDEIEAEEWVNRQVDKINATEAPAQNPVTFTIMNLIEPYA